MFAPFTAIFRGSQTLATALLLACVGLAGADTPADRAVQLSASIQHSPPSIQLSWLPNPDGLDYMVYRKAPDVGAWGTGIPLEGAATSYVDHTVTPGVEYEYCVVKTTAIFPGYGFICAGIDTPLVEDRGRLILIVDASQASVLGAELARLQQDLMGDGWQVIRHDVSREAGVKKVKELIAGDYSADPGNVRSVLLFGHVPVPYSGDFAPDGHSDHSGAWPADAYYGDLNGAWTDATANHSTAADSRNWNTPGDGKFDQTTIPSLVELQVGRVDLANMPSFALTETELLRRYLNKDHRFRHKMIAPQAGGLIDDGLGSFVEAFAADGWRNFSSLFGAPNVTAGPWFPTLTDQPRLWAYGCGLGTYTSAGIIDVPKFSSIESNAVFTALFGSYFGDWDAADSLLRAPLANAGSGLTCAWAGRPFWYFHQMGHGHTIGYCAQVTQNNSGVYPANANARGVHIALMGDPTLRLHPVAPPSNLAAARPAMHRANLSWSASPDAVAGYHVYRAAGPDGPFARLNRSLIPATTFDDPSPLRGGIYMVRAVKLQQTSGGTYWNASQGIFVDLDLPGVTVTPSVPVTSSLGSNAAEFVFARSGSIVSPLTVRYALRGDAINGVDYEALDEQLDIPAGNRTAVLRIVAKAGGNDQSRKLVRAILTDGNDYVRGVPASAVAVITDESHLFRPYGGNYRGMLASPSPSTTAGGIILISVDHAGRFSAVIQFRDQRVRIAGALDSTGAFSAPVPDHPGLAIELTLDLDHGSDSITGRLTMSGSIASTFEAQREFAAPGNSIASGYYTVALLPDAAPADPMAPQGPGWGTLRIDRGGRGRFVGVLGDGKVFYAVAVLSRDGRWPLFSRLYRGKGWIGGEIAFSDVPGDSDASGRLHWERPQLQLAALYPGGFATDVTLVASRYVPTKSANWLDYQHAIGNGRWVAQGGGITSRIEKLLTIDSSGITPIGSAPSDRFTLNLDAPSGLVRGSFFHPVLNRTVAFRGVALQKQKKGVGCFVGGTKTGLVTVEQNAAIPGTAGGRLNGDSVPPTITISAPAAMARIPEVPRGGMFILPSAIVSGVAADHAGIASVEYQVFHRGVVSSLQPAGGISSWSFPLYINPEDAGEYTVFVKAIDANGNESILASRAFIYVVLRDLTVTVAGGGAVSGGFLGTTSREVGKDYTIQAIPAVGWKFIGWTGSATSAGSSITFTMAEGMRLQANFAPK